MLCLSAIAVLIPVLFGSGGSDDSSPEPQIISAWSQPPVPASEDLACATDATSPACLYGQGRLTATAPEATIAAATAAPELTPEAVAAAAEPDPTAEPWPTMELRSGDTLYALAEWFGVSAWDIAVANGASIDDIFQIGQVIAIPVPSWEFALPPDPAQAVLARTAEVEETPEYVAPPDPTPLPYYYSGSTDDVVAAICSLPWPCDQMVRIASCESGLNPNSMNPAGYYGLFQINFSFDGWNDPWRNAQVAYETKYLPALLAGGDGLSPWPACRYY